MPTKSGGELTLHKLIVWIKVFKKTTYGLVGSSCPSLGSRRIWYGRQAVKQLWGVTLGRLLKVFKPQSLNGDNDALLGEHTGTE